MRTPWGQAQHVEQINQQILFASTASHGGYKITPQLKNLMKKLNLPAQTWYEEDCEWLFLAIVEPNSFPQTTLLEAQKSLIRWFPQYKDAINKIMFTQLVMLNQSMPEIDSVTQDARQTMGE